jgi:hypothetical protein
MLLGRLLTLINFVLLGTAIAVYLYVPSIADIFLYALLAWMFGSIILFYLPISQRRIGSGAAPPPAPSTTSAAGPAGAGTLPSLSPLPTAAALASEPSAFAFCIYCGTDLPAGAVICPACGKPVRRI